MASFKRITNTAFWFIMVMLAIGAIFILTAQLGWIPIKIQFVESDSMVPTFAKGDIVLIRPLDNNEIVSIGDIVSFQLTNKAQAIHRIYSKTDNCIITKGDANNDPDTGGCRKLLGKLVVSVPKIGWFFMGLQRGINIVFMRSR